MPTKYLVVYRYEYWDEQMQQVRTSTAYATLDAIVKASGRALMDTGKLVPRSLIAHELPE